MTKARASVGNYWVDGNTVQTWGFFDTVRAYDKYVEGIAKACDEVSFFNFAGGRDSAILLAQHSFRNGRVFHGYKEEIKAGQAAPEVSASQAKSGT